MEDKNLYHLIVNPYIVNRKQPKKHEENTLDNSLISLLKKIYQKYKFETDDYKIIIKKIDDKIYDLYIKNLTNNIINNIIQNTLDEL